ncbi:MAG: hypothetical protein AAGE52_29690 [Myxococcota bacterium]
MEIVDAYVHPSVAPARGTPKRVRWLLRIRVLQALEYVGLLHEPGWRTMAGKLPVDIRRFCGRADLDEGILEMAPSRGAAVWWVADAAIRQVRDELSDAGDRFQCFSAAPGIAVLFAGIQPDIEAAFSAADAPLDDPEWILGQIAHFTGFRFELSELILSKKQREELRAEFLDLVTPLADALAPFARDTPESRLRPYTMADREHHQALIHDLLDSARRAVVAKAGTEMQHLRRSWARLEEEFTDCFRSDASDRRAMLSNLLFRLVEEYLVVEWHREPIPYSPRMQLEVGDIVEHSKFGTGDVLELADGKARIRFGDEVKILAFGRG